MAKFISFQKAEKNYILLNLYLILTVIIFDAISILFEQNSKYDEINNLLLVFKFCIRYFILFIFMIIIAFIIKKISSPKLNKTIDLKNKNKLKAILYFFLICLFLLIYNFTDILFHLYQSKNPIQLDIKDFYCWLYLTIFIINIFMFKNSYYKHQYISITIIIVLGIIESSFKYSKNNYNFKDIIFILFLIIITNISLGFYISCSKILIDRYYFSPYKICYLIGLVNGSIFLIISIILSFIPCPNSFCLLKYNNEYYFDNYKYFFTKLNLKQQIGFLINSPTNIIYIIFINLIIEKYTICHTFLLYKMLELINYIFGLIDEDNKNYLIIILMYIIIALDIFFILVFLEIIELKFCGLNKYIKKNIKKRAIEDVNEALTNKKEIFEIDNDYFINYDDVEKGKKEKNDEIELNNQ